MSKKECTQQQSIFDIVKTAFTNQPKKEEKIEWRLCVDGASRGNPGKAGAGMVIYKNNKKHLSHGFFIGTRTNNEAEYIALFIGVYYLKKEASPFDLITIISDSELLIRQCQGSYRVRKAELKQLYDAVMHELQGFTYVFQHVMRENNTVADSLANKGIDDGVHLPLTLLNAFHLYDIHT